MANLNRLWLKNRGRRDCVERSLDCVARLLALVETAVKRGDRIAPAESARALLTPLALSTPGTFDSRSSRDQVATCHPARTHHTASEGRVSPVISAMALYPCRPAARQYG